MPKGTKIATCCYCGTRAALVLTARDHHELACSSCGAPLHDLKALKKPPERRPKPRPVADRPQKKRKRKKSLGRKLFSEAADFFEDLLD